MDAGPLARERKSHIWKRHADDWYVEPRWCSERLFDVEPFVGEVIDPCCGSGNIVESAKARGHCAAGWDIVDRGYPLERQGSLFDRGGELVSNFVMNPPFKLAPDFVDHALSLARNKVCALFPIARMNAAHWWLQQLPLARIWLLTPRPSMPPGDMREKPASGGKVDFCWLVFAHGHSGPVTIDWLHRDRS